MTISAVGFLPQTAPVASAQIQKVTSVFNERGQIATRPIDWNLQSTDSFDSLLRANGFNEREVQLYNEYNQKAFGPGSGQETDVAGRGVAASSLRFLNAMSEEDLDRETIGQGGITTYRGLREYLRVKNDLSIVVSESFKNQSRSAAVVFADPGSASVDERRGLQAAALLGAVDLNRAGAVQQGRAFLDGLRSSAPLDRVVLSGEAIARMIADNQKLSSQFEAMLSMKTNEREQAFAKLVAAPPLDDDKRRRVDTRRDSYLYRSFRAGARRARGATSWRRSPAGL